MSTEIQEILKSSKKIKKFKPKFASIFAGLFFIFGCILYVYSVIRDSNDITTGLFFISVGLLWFILSIITKQSKVNLELIDHIQEIEDRLKIKNSDS